MSQEMLKTQDEAAPDIPKDASAAEAVPQFYIPATESLQIAWPHTLKHGNTFALFDDRGDILNAKGNPAGIFHDDTRYLSGTCLFIDGHRPLLLSSTVQEDNAMLTVDLANPDIYREKELILTRETLHLVRTKFLWRGTCFERIAIQNFDSQPHKNRISLAFDADFADLFEVRGITRARRGTKTIEIVGDDLVVFHYRGLDGVDRYTHIRFDPPPTVLTERGAALDVSLEAHEQKAAFIAVQCGTDEKVGGMQCLPALRASRRAAHHDTQGTAVVETSNDLFNQVLCRAVADIYMLITRTPEGLYPYAGIPWFSTPFGRDGIITALQTLWLDPEISKGVLKFLATTQATKFDAASDAEPGKILHEMRSGEMANLHEVPFGRYYGSVDATPLFVMLAGAYFQRTGDLETMRAIWPNIQAALEWIDKYGDVDGDGFVEYRRQSDNGLRNQGWKDSNDSIMHADGTLAEGSIALCEVQSYVYSGKYSAALICRALGRDDQAKTLAEEAEKLRDRFEEAFWCADLGTYALALDGAKKPCRVTASNPGHALMCGIASPEHAAGVAKSLLNRECFSGWGIRTLSSAETRFNPMSYHNGSVWP
ncbi:MAG TPA: glycogen debranching N-terminal domain-containing protein, partial [Rhizomicrobium sp.]|nr:glycogen debranching N-terminal domain-containing protein [Rhizomicrobium sp.]